MIYSSRRKAGVASIFGSAFIALSFFFKDYAGIFWITGLFIFLTALFFALQGMEDRRKQVSWLVLSLVTLVAACAIVAGVILLAKG
jgi:hypothetical protein